MQKEFNIEKIKQILDGNFEKSKEQLIYASLLIMIFEEFKKLVLDNVESFFSSRFYMENGNLVFERGEEFKKLIKEYGKGKHGQHKKGDFRAAMNFFESHNAISQEENNEVERLFLLRNDIGHELFGILFDDNIHPITKEDILFVYLMFLKILRWWYKEIEATTNPDYDQETYELTDFDNVHTGQSIILQVLVKIDEQKS
jgi:hypothetical protein